MGVPPLATLLRKSDGHPITFICLSFSLLFGYNPKHKLGWLFLKRKGTISMLLEATIRKMLVNGDQWAGWKGYQLPLSDQYVSVWTPIGTEMRWKPGTWISQKHQISYFWANAWHTIHIGYYPDGSFASGYCDVVLPTSSYSSTSPELIYVDLYIDVVIRADYSVYTKDQEVFDRAALHYPIVEQSRQKSFEVLDWLEQHAKHWSGPFCAIPRQLPRTDFETLTPDEAATSLRAVSRFNP
jgi:protein associated with RNAse G/E